MSRRSCIRAEPRFGPPETGASQLANSAGSELLELESESERVEREVTECLKLYNCLDTTTTSGTLHTMYRKLEVVGLGLGSVGSLARNSYYF